MDASSDCQAHSPTVDNVSPTPIRWWLSLQLRVSSETCLLTFICCCCVKLENHSWMVWKFKGYSGLRHTSQTVRAA